MGKNTVVIIDDDESVLEALEAMLCQTILDVRTFSDPAIGLARMEECDPQLVILDYNMPEFSGQTLMIKISEALVFGKATFVILTGEDFSDSKKMMLATCGIEKVYEKPISMKQLMELAERVFPKDLIYES